MSVLSHTPPALHGPSSYEAAHQKRSRSTGGSISVRLRSASELEDRGIIDSNEKTVLKDLIISGDERLQTALDRFESGDTSELEVLMQNGVLNKRGSMDLLEDLDLNFLQVGNNSATSSNGQDRNSGSGQTTGLPPPPVLGLGTQAPSRGSSTQQGQALDALSEVIGGGHNHNKPGPYELNLDDLPFETSFDVEEEGAPSSIGSSNSAADARHLLDTGGTPPSPSMLGRTPPDPFKSSFEEFSLMDGNTNSNSSSTSSSSGGNSASDSSSNNTNHHHYHNSTNDHDNHHRTNHNTNNNSGSSAHLWLRCKQGGGGSRAIAIPGSNGKTQAQRLSDMIGPGDTGVPAPNGRATPTFTRGAVTAGDGRQDYIGAYSPDARKKRIMRFMEKRKRRVWTKKVKYDVRKNFADSRMRVKGRFVKKEDEELLRELMSIT